MKYNPVLVILNGLAAVVSLGLIAAAGLGWIHLDAVVQAEVVAFVTGVANLVGLAIRSAVVPVARHDEVVAETVATTKAVTLAQVNQLAPAA